MSAQPFTSARTLLSNFPKFAACLGSDVVYKRAKHLSDALLLALDHKPFVGLYRGVCEPVDFVPEFEYYAQIDAGMKAAVRLLSRYLTAGDSVGLDAVSDERRAADRVFKTYGYDADAISELIEWANERGGVHAPPLFNFVHSKQWRVSCPIIEGLSCPVERTSGALIARYRHNEQKYFKVLFPGDVRTYLVIAKDGREAYCLIDRIIRAYRTWSNKNVELDIALAARENRRSILYAKDGFVMLAADSRSAASVASAAMSALGL